MSLWKVCRPRADCLILFKVERSGQRLAERLNCTEPDPLPCLQVFFSWLWQSNILSHQALEGSVVLDPAQGVQDILVPDSKFFISAPNIDTDSENPFLPYDPLYQTVTGLFKKVKWSQATCSTSCRFPIYLASTPTRAGSPCSRTWSDFTRFQKSKSAIDSCCFALS